MTFELVGYKKLNLLTILILIVVLYLFVGLHHLKNKLGIKNWFVYTLIAVTIFVVLSILVNKDVSSRHLFLFYLLGIYYLVKELGIEKYLLLKITNYTYLIYLILSMLVYFSIIQWPTRELNIFSYEFLGLKLNTFIGYYGSTAHLDSYSLLIVILNLYFNRNYKEKIFISIIASIFTIGTFTMTPLLALVVAVMCSLIIITFKNIKKITIPLFTMVFILFFFIILQLSLLFNAIEFFGLATNGRNKIWIEMWKIYIQNDISLKWLLGYVNTEEFAVIPFGAHVGEYTNPHNNYFRYLIEYGVIFFATSSYFITKNVKNLKRFSSLLLAFFLLMIGNTNNEIFDLVNPIYLIWFLVLISNKNEKS
jgi:O-Antigen ligase